MYMKAVWLVLYITRTVKYLYSFLAVLNCTFTLTCSYWVDWTMNVTYLFQRFKSVAFYTCSHLWRDQMSESSIKESVENVP